MEDLLNGYFLQVLTFVCINIILAMTIYMTLCTGILSLGNAGLMSFGAYTSAILTAQYHVPMPVGIFLGGVMARIILMQTKVRTCRKYPFSKSSITAFLPSPLSQKVLPDE